MPEFSHFNNTRLVYEIELAAGSIAKGNRIFDNLENEWIYPILSTTGRTIKDPGVPGVA